MIEKAKVTTIKPKDFDATWERWLKEVHDVPNHIEIDQIVEEDYGREIKFRYDSVAGTKIFAILYLNTKENKPVFSWYHGHNSYTESPGDIWHCKNLVNAGYSVVAIDMRFQGNRVEDNNHYNFKDYPSACYNITDIENSYNKRLDQDALKIIDIISDENIFPELAGKPIYVAGPSQGGGLSMMVAAMRNDIIKGSLSDVPSDCALKDRILGRYGKYQVIKDFLDDHPEHYDVVMKNQDYFDVINMAERIKCPIITSVGTLDETCPARFFKVAYDLISSHKELYEYEFGHGGFEELHLPKKIEFIDKVTIGLIK